MPLKPIAKAWTELSHVAHLVGARVFTAGPSKVPSAVSDGPCYRKQDAEWPVRASGACTKPRACVRGGGRVALGRRFWLVGKFRRRPGCSWTSLLPPHSRKHHNRLRSFDDVPNWKCAKAVCDFPSCEECCQYAAQGEWKCLAKKAKAGVCFSASTLVVVALLTGGSAIRRRRIEL